ncbi:hypothetical protein BLA29_012345 [Euroglyphus maynei]|uniref:Uncharacterized protein n=1 Tax=Euroglyphus maynei TaxID=6958 RepID=A0A1Y3BBZ2_EURMA|nr:hypothetical protein BLA29_012345 [Euroglyphus maynei]
MRNEYQLFERITGYSNSMENICAIFPKPNNKIGSHSNSIGDRNSTDSLDVFNRFTLSRLANNFEDKN